MYMARVILDRNLMGVKVYEKYEHALSDALDRDSGLHSCLPEDRLADYGMPRIVAASCDGTGFMADFEYRYQNGVTVCIEEIMSEEEARRKACQ